VIVVALNLGPERASIASDSIGFGRQILLSTFLDRQGEEIHEVLDLRGNEGVMLGVAAQAG
jgi:alpha-glucosidase